MREDMPPKLSMRKMSSTIYGRNIATRTATDKAAVFVLRLGEAGDNHRSLVGGNPANNLMINRGGSLLHRCRRGR
jgi:hypothetical protein